MSSGSGIIVSGSTGIYEWSAPIDYSSVVFHGGGLFPNAGTFYHDASVRKNNGALVNGPTWQWVPELGRWGLDFLTASSRAVTFPTVSGIQTVVAWANCTSTSSPVYPTIVGSASGSDSCYLRPATERQQNTRGGVNSFYDWGPATDMFGWHLYSWRYKSGSTAGFMGRDAEFALKSTTNTNALSLDIIGGDGVTANFSGQIADVLLSTEYWSDSQIAWLANRANNPWQPWRRKWWPVVTATPVAGGWWPVTTRRGRIIQAA